MELQQVKLQCNEMLYSKMNMKECVVLWISLIDSVDKHHHIPLILSIFKTFKSPNIAIELYIEPVIYYRIMFAPLVYPLCAFLLLYDIL